MARRSRGIAALLGVVLVVAWAFGWAGGASRWLVWTNLGAAVVVFAGLGPASIDDAQGFGTWPFVGLALFAAWMFGLAVGATTWLTWLNFAVACAFLILSFALVAANTDTYRHFRQRHGWAH
jgi:hypothetical protein